MFGIFKGWIGERAAQFGMWMYLDKRTYPRIHNLVIPAQGGTTQIDHVIVSVFGIFVVETKNMSGWIFGDERSAKWTQCIYGKKTQFQNPLRQNYRHTKALSEFLDLPHELFHSVVFFNGECEFKTALPENVMTNGVSTYIRAFTERIFSSGEVEEIIYRLAREKRAPVATLSAHVSGLRERHDGSSCPKCGKELVLRTARRGPNAGGMFQGCSGYPSCRYTRSSD